MQIEKEINNIAKDEVFSIKEKEQELDVLRDKLDKLLDTFLSSSETMQKLVEKKVGELEYHIKRLELEISNIKSIYADKEKHLRQLNNKIIKLKQELINSTDKELTRKEWLDKVNKIIIESKISFNVVYNLD